jgi:tetratricopeptide (TPR) repeat protein
MATGFDFIYNLEYDEAEKVLTKMVDLMPEDPAGYCYLATNLWLRELNRARELSLENFTSAGYFTKGPKRTVAPELEAKFREWVEKGIEKANALLQKNNRDARAYYFLGTAYGTLGAYDATIDRKFISALRHGNKSFDYHKKVLEIDPTFYDAYLTVGLYDYITGSLPWSVKWLAKVLGYRGNKARGLEALKLAAGKGTYNRNDAKVILAVLSVRERRLEDALNYMTDLHRLYPKNYLLHVDIAAIYQMMNQPDKAIETYEDILGKIKSRAPHYEQLKASSIHYRLGSIFLDRSNHGSAIEHLSQVAGAAKTGQEEDVVTLSHLKLGQAYELAQDHAKAREQYQIVLQRKDINESHSLARKYSRRLK